MAAAVVLGAAGTFGSIICRRLARHGIPLVLVGRTQAPLEALRADLPAGASVRVCDVSDAPRLRALLGGLDAPPLAVVHTAGPFQGGYGVAEACIAERVPYVDLADNSEFVLGIDALDAAARAAGVPVVSGASTVPALSSAAARELAGAVEGGEVAAVDVSISPGNKLPRGLATVRSVLAYCGKTVPALPAPVVGWRGLQEEHFPGLSPPRLVANVDVPDLTLLPRLYPSAARVSVRAGLELRPMMWALSALARLGLRDPARWAAPMLRASNWVRWLGTDDGSMEVAVTGASGDVQSWSLIARGGDGPNVPCVASELLLLRLRAGELPAGARPCLEEFSLAEAERALSETIDVSFYRNGPCRRRDALPRAAPGPYAVSLGERATAALPAFLREFHSRGGPGAVEGTLKVTRGRGLLRGLLCDLGGLPKAAEAAAVRVDVAADGAGGERWQRSFDGKPMPSRITYSKGLVREGFFPFSFGFLMRPLEPASAGFEHVTRRMWAFGVPVPRALMMTADGVTWALPDGEDGWRLRVSVRVPLLGELVRYEGSMRPAPSP